MIPLLALPACDSRQNDSQATSSVSANEDEQINQNESHAYEDSSKGNAEHGAEFRAVVGFDPQGREMWVPVDLDMLGPNGELTVKFIKSISPVQCHALQTRGLDMESTDLQDIEIALAHILVHRADAEKVKAICAGAQKAWQERYTAQHPAPDGP